MNGRQVNINSKRLNNLTSDFYEAVKRLQILQSDHDETKAKTIYNSYAISYVTSRLLIRKGVIQEAARRWKAGKFYA